MCKQLIITEWNINQRSNWNKKGNIPKWVAEEIKNNFKPDIAIFTEFYKTHNWLNEFAYELSEYNTFTSNNPKGNEILIAVKKEIRVVSLKELPSHELTANFLQIDVEYKSKLISIIGIRIRLDDKILQLNQLCDYLKMIENENVIVLGDFNVWYTWASKGKNMPLPEKYKIYGPQFIMKPGEWKSLTKWSFVFDDNSKGPIDFAIAKGLTLNVDYSWNYLKNEKYSGIMDADKYKGDDSGNPDHAILISKVEL